MILAGLGDLPALPQTFLPVNLQKASKARKKQNLRNKSQVDRGLTKLPTLTIRQKVIVQDPVLKKWDSKRVNKGNCKTKCSYSLLET